MYVCALLIACGALFPWQGGPKPPKPTLCSDNESDDEAGVHMMFSKYCERMTAGGNFDDEDNDVRNALCMHS